MCECGGGDECGGGVGGGGECGGGEGALGSGGGINVGMKTTRNDSPAAKEAIVNKTRPRSTSEIIKDITVKATGN